MASKAETAQAAQTGLAVVLARQVDQAWHLLNLADLDSSLPQFKLAIAALVHRYGLASGTLSAQFYAEQRHEAAIFARYTTRVGDPAPLEQVDAAVSWATRGLWQPNADIESAKTLTEGVASKMVLDVGRDTIVDTAQTDPKAIGWARVTKADCCYFCAMLASRGAVYKSEGTADFQAHNHDRCYVEPVFNAYEPTAQIRRWQAEWREVTKGQPNQMLAWRRHFENRSPAATSTTPGGSE